MAVLGVILLILGVLFILATIKTPPKSKKDAEIQESIQKNKKKFRVTGIILVFVGLALISYVDEEKSSTIQPKTAEVEKPSTAQVSKYTHMKTLRQLDEAEDEFLNIFKKADIKIETDDSPLADGTPRKIYKTELSIIEIIGKPEVKEVSIFFAPSKDFTKNNDVIISLGATMKVFCSEKSDYEENITYLFNSLTNFIKNKTSEKTINVGKCNVEFARPSKELPFYFVMFKAI
ncbi:hypothetical protein [Thermodesulfovibrio sp.]|uniref:hypothetical protein n=1 Tax=Thermodesulfovibrio sp. TaxID=2067987 RepID=UPI0030AABEC9